MREREPKIFRGPTPRHKEDDQVVYIDTNSAPRMLFSGEERMKPTATLSGGETVRALLSKLMMDKNNVLILDEPTNHLDLESISALAEGIKRYEGTAIVVTHDQELINECATRIWAIPRPGHEVIDFTGNFTEFNEKHAELAQQRR